MKLFRIRHWLKIVTGTLFLSVSHKYPSTQLWLPPPPTTNLYGCISYPQLFHLWPPFFFSPSILPSFPHLSLSSPLSLLRTETGLIETNELGSKSDLITLAVWGCWLHACWGNVAELVGNEEPCLFITLWLDIADLQMVSCMLFLTRLYGSGEEKENRLISYLFLFAPFNFWQIHLFFIQATGYCS